MSIITPDQYKIHHDGVSQYLDWKLCKRYKIDTPAYWYEHLCEPVFEDNNVTILWDFRINANRTIQANQTYLLKRRKKILVNK